MEAAGRTERETETEKQRDSEKKQKNTDPLILFFIIIKIYTERVSSSKTDGVLISTGVS